MAFSLGYLFRPAWRRQISQLLYVDRARLGATRFGYLPHLSEILGVGRGRRFGLVLGYQNVGQLYKQHGRDGTQAILGSIGTQIFLPGLDSETAQYAVKRIGRTTVLQHTPAYKAIRGDLDRRRDVEAALTTNRWISTVLPASMK